MPIARTVLQRVIVRGLCVSVVGVAFLAGCVMPEPMMLVEPSSDGMEDEIAAAPMTGVPTKAKPTSAPAPAAATADSQLRSAVAALQVDVAELQVGSDAVETRLAGLGAQVNSIEEGVDTLTERVVARFSDVDASLAALTAANSSSGAKQQNGRDIEAEVALAVDMWREGWEKEDLAAYMAMYDKNANITRTSLANGGMGSKTQLTPAQLRERMQRLFRQYDRTEVLVRGFRVLPEGDRVTATFQQEFSAFSQPGDLKPVYTDKGVKTLIFKEQDGRWHVVEENWAPIRR